jgi:hypothetical protein
MLSIRVQCKRNRAIRLVLGQTAGLDRNGDTEEDIAGHTISSTAARRRSKDSDSPSEISVMCSKASR